MADKGFISFLHYFTAFCAISKGAVFSVSRIFVLGITRIILKEAVVQSLGEEYNTTEINNKLFALENDLLRGLYLDGWTFYEAFWITIAFLALMSFQYAVLKAVPYYIAASQGRDLRYKVFSSFILDGSGGRQLENKDCNEIVFTHTSIIERFISDHKYDLFENITGVLTPSILMLFLKWYIGLWFLCVTIIALGYEALLERFSSRSLSRREKRVNDTNAYLVDVIKARDTVRGHVMENNEALSFQKMLPLDAHDVKLTVMFRGAQNFVLSLLFAITPILWLLESYEREPTVDQVIKVITALILMDEAMRNFLALGRNKEKKEASDNSEKGISEKIPKMEDFNPKNETHEKDFTENDCKSGRRSSFSDDYTLRGNLVMNNVTMGYGYAQKKILEDVNLTIGTGSHYAIIGETGVGKSTIFKSVAGLLPLMKGHFTISKDDKEDVVNPMSSDWRQHVDMVTQDTVLLNRTVRENLVYGLSYISDADIWEALEKVNLTTMVKNLPQQLETKVLYNGEEFSGGQRQRIQIARLFLGHAKLVLLDEPTSALDSKTIHKIMPLLQSFLKGKTVILVTHDESIGEMCENSIELSIDDVTGKKHVHITTNT
eukprot:m.3000 g.3000  ORF g.3000 m.3000 type:complete len:604 (+) comp2642_c0_seq1:92-1903(+)